MAEKIICQTNCFQGEDDNSSWYSTGVILDGRAKKKCQTEVEVIRDWFVNIFMPLEKTGDLEVTDFKFEQIAHWQGTASSSGNNTTSGPSSEVAGGGAANGNTSNGNGSASSSARNGTMTSSGGYPGATESDTSTNTTTQTTTTTQQGHIHTQNILYSMFQVVNL